MKCPDCGAASVTINVYIDTKTGGRVRSLKCENGHRYRTREVIYPEEEWRLNRINFARERQGLPPVKSAEERERNRREWQKAYNAKRRAARKLEKQQEQERRIEQHKALIKQSIAGKPLINLPVFEAEQLSLNDKIRDALGISSTMMSDEGSALAIATLKALPAVAIDDRAIRTRLAPGAPWPKRDENTTH